VSTDGVFATPTLLLDLNGNGDGGEGMALQKLKDGRRILYLAHE
jgi:hypothetical protein